MRKTSIYFFGLLLSSIINITVTLERNPKKRQIYREQVLPHAGGKIPDTAFESDRLFLNRLQKEGIAVPDGVVTEQRNPQVYQYYDKSPRLVFRVALSSDGRYTPAEGRYRHRNTPTIETTYLYPQIHGRLNDVSTSSKTAYPKYRQLHLHNSQLNQVRLQPKKKTQYIDITPTLNRPQSNTFRTQSYQNFNIINTPIVPPSSAEYRPDGDTNSGSDSKVEYYVQNANAAAHASYVFFAYSNLINAF